MERWGEREGEVIEFKYDPEINIGQTYIWLSVHCKKLELIREELGLDACFDKFKWFHITIANMKQAGVAEGQTHRTQRKDMLNISKFEP